MKSLAFTFLLVLPFLAAAQPPCSDAKAFENTACVLTIEHIYTEATSEEEYAVLALFSEPTRVQVKSVTCTDEGFCVTVVCPNGQKGFFYAGTLEQLHTVLRRVQPTDLGAVTF